MSTTQPPSPPTNDFDPLDFLRQKLQACNHTELYQLCRNKGLAASPNYSRERLIEIFIFSVDQDPTPNIFDSWRQGLTGFVFEYWKRLEPQLDCPIRSKDPKSCWGCLDAQVVACLKENSKYKNTINLHRKDKPQ